MSRLATNPFSSLSHNAKRWRARSLKSLSASFFLLPDVFEAMIIAQRFHNATTVKKKWMLNNQFELLA
jgi:hypothetical protein